MKNIPNKIALSVAFIVVFFDQMTKLVLEPILSKGSIPIIENIIHFTLVYNKGAGFGIFQGQRIFFIVFSLAILAILFYNWRKIPKDRNILIPTGLILGGLLGNLIDRMIYGYVIDFIDLQVWPVFNIADSAITAGAIWLVIYLWKK